VLTTVNPKKFKFKIMFRYLLTSLSIYFNLGLGRYILLVYSFRTLYRIL